MNQIHPKAFDNVVPLRTPLLADDKDPGPGARGLKWGMAVSLGAWVVFGLVIFFATGCAQQRTADAPSPWGLDRNGAWVSAIPKPIDCSTPAVPKCQRWDEPGMMVRP